MVDVSLFQLAVCNIYKKIPRRAAKKQHRNWNPRNKQPLDRLQQQLPSRVKSKSSGGNILRDKLQRVWSRSDLCGRKGHGRYGNRGNQLWDLDPDSSPLPCAAGNLHPEIRAVEHAQAFMDIGDANAPSENLRHAV